MFPKPLQLGMTQLPNSASTENLVANSFWVLLGKVQIRSYSRAVVLNWGSSASKGHLTTSGDFFGCYKLLVGHKWHLVSGGQGCC